MRAALKLGWGVKERRRRRIRGLEGEDGKGVVFRAGALRRISY